MRVDLRVAIGVLAALAVLGGCANRVPASAPQWFQSSTQEKNRSYPNLRDVPRTTQATTDPAYWSGVQAEVVAAKQAMQANPRAQPAPPQDPDAFVNDARAAIDATRASHE